MYQLPQNIIDELLLNVRRAGEACLEIYAKDDFGIQIKSDNSPVTQADLIVNRILTDALQRLTPDIPVISEEANLPYEERKDYSLFWILDPIDGTKEFIKRSGEFTLNIGLVENQKPIFGIIYIPVLNEMFWGGKDLGAFCDKGHFSPYANKNIQTRNMPFASESNARIERAIDITCSKDHRHPNDWKVIEKMAMEHYIKLIPCGSTIKICRIAEGNADIYIRMSGINDWDLAAGHAIVEAAGGYVTTLDNRELIYNTEKQRLEPFIVCGKTQLFWNKWAPNDNS